jgi:hypothetical protein
MVLQFGGASGSGYLSVAEREAANDALKQKGEFRNGVFTYYDDKGQRHNQDASEACFEYATGRKLTFAPPRYEDVIVMNPSAYAWINRGISGVRTKWLGSFTERNARIGFIRIDRGAVYAGGEHPSIEILFQTKGEVAVADEKFGPESAFEFSPEEGPIPVRALEASEFLCMVLHQL